MFLSASRILGIETIIRSNSYNSRASILLCLGLVPQKRHADSEISIRTEVVQATIKRESAEQAAEAKLFSETKSANGLLYKERQAAEGRLFMDTKSAEGLLYKQRQDAEANCEPGICSEKFHWRKLKPSSRLPRRETGGSHAVC